MSRHSFLRNAVTSYGERGLLLGSTLLLTPFLLGGLGVAGFGTWSVMFTVTTIFTMLEVGFSAGITRFVAAALGREAPADAERVARAGVLLMALLGIVALAVSVAIAFAADGLAADGDREAFRAGMIVLGAAMFIRLPCVAYGAALLGHQRYDLYSAAQAVVTVGFVVGAVIAIETGGGLRWVASAQAIALVAGGVLFAVLLRWVAPAARLRPVRLRPGERLLSFSSYALLADSAVFVGQRMDTVVVAAFRGAAAAAPIAVAAKLQSGLQAMTLPILNMLLPMAAAMESRGHGEHLAHRHILATRVTLQLTLPIAGALALFAGDVTDLWLGADAPAKTATILAVLSLQTIFLSAVPAEKILIGIGRVRLIGTLNVAEGLANVGLSIALVAAYGAVGAAAATLITSALLGPLKWPAACRALGRPTVEFLRGSVGAAVLASFPALAAMALIRMLLEPGHGRLAAGAVVGLSLAAAVGLYQVGGPRALGHIRGNLAVPRPGDPDVQAVVRTPDIGASA
ncbi:MAG: oligosaccharide flippase family protein [Solirubrobacteraceae bacterium MAG38_C4-C5]|nr:oligosaccharide flippase family protein [Candidatus Siliceabacter maunaloa]